MWRLLVLYSDVSDRSAAFGHLWSLSSDVFKQQCGLPAAGERCNTQHSDIKRNRESASASQLTISLACMCSFLIWCTGSEIYQLHCTQQLLTWAADTEFTWVAVQGYIKKQERKLKWQDFGGGWWGWLITPTLEGTTGCTSAVREKHASNLERIMANIFSCHIF